MPKEAQFIGYSGYDKTLPKVIKPNLYAYDEYQTYDLIHFGFPWSNFFAKVANERFLFQRFSPWEYPWCEGYTQRLFNLQSNIGVGIFAYTDSSLVVNRRYFQGEVNEFEAFAYSSKIYRMTIFNHFRRFINNTTRKREVPININSSESDEIFITFLIADVDCFSKAYQIVNLKKGNNDFALKFSQSEEYTQWPIASGSVVVSSASNNEDNVNGINNALRQAIPDALWIDYDKIYDNFILSENAFVNNIASAPLASNRKYRYFPGIDCTPKSSIYFANNNYWNNGKIYEDVNPRTTWGTDFEIYIDWYRSIEEADYGYYHPNGPFGNGEEPYDALP